MVTKFDALFMFALLLIIPSRVLNKETNETKWTFEEPEKWGGQCQTGKRQSPIDIQRGWFADNNVPEIKFVNYDENGNVTIRNDGHAVIVSGFNTWEKQPHIAEGGFGSKYMLSQFHFHWSQNGNGSEHRVSGKHFAAELHLVHIKEGLSSSEALALPDGVAVLGVFFRIGSDGRALSALQNGISQVTDEHASVPIDHCVPGDLLPNNLGTFFRYNGSLTMPNCEEVVVWSVFAKPQSISREQMQLLRAIKGHDGKVIRSNVRPVQKFERKSPNQKAEKSKERYA